MKAPLEHQVVELESQGNQFCMCGVSESAPPLGLLKLAPFWHCREVKRLLSRVVFSQLVFFLETRAGFPSGISTIRQGVPRRVRDTPPPGLGRESTPG